MAGRVGIVLFRKDLRLEDNPALDQVCDVCDVVIPLFVWSPDELAPWAPGAASRYWLHQSLKSLGASLERVGSRLILAQGDSVATVLDLAKTTGATFVAWNRRYEPAAIMADTRLKSELTENGIEAVSFNGSLLVEPWDITTKSGTPFKVFTPFWKACLNQVDVGDSLVAPDSIPAPQTWPASLGLDALGLEPLSDWAGGIREHWEFGEAAAHACLGRFLDEGVCDYSDARDQLGEYGTSNLSPYLAWGEISPRQIVNATHARMAQDGQIESTGAAFLRQLYWREFAYHLLYHEPQTTTEPLRPEFAAFPWVNDDEVLKTWRRGQTGYPIVDAAMQELWVTGIMHNRTRMVVASFLVKHLLIPWQEGAAWFWDTLVDADLANNTLGWQWTAGCGADAAPYFRVFNPILQGERFDGDGAYVRRWLPALAKMPDKYIHRPWEAPQEVLAKAGVLLGDTYPERIVDHSEARDAALAAYEAIKK